MVDRHHGAEQPRCEVCHLRRELEPGLRRALGGDVRRELERVLDHDQGDRQQQPLLPLRPLALLVEAGLQLLPLGIAQLGRALLLWEEPAQARAASQLLRELLPHHGEYLPSPFKQGIMRRDVWEDSVPVRTTHPR